MSNSDNKQNPSTLANKAVSFSIFFLVCGIALLVIRHFFVLNSKNDFGSSIEKTYLVSFLFSIPFAVFAIYKLKPTTLKTTIAICGIAGFVGTSLCIAILGGELAQKVHTDMPEYWNWSRDWPEFVFKIVCLRGLAGAAIGIAVAIIFKFFNKN